MRLKPMLLRSAPQNLDRGVWKRRGLAPGSPHDCKDSGNTQDAAALSTPDTNKEVTGKQGQFQIYSGAVAPLPLGAVKREIMFDFALSQVLRNPLFVPAGGIDGKPGRNGRYSRSNPREGRVRMRIFENAYSQGFAILTWVKVFHKKH
jgi:hypothetical protein